MEKKVIGVYAPANPAHIWFEEKYLFAKKQLENMGFEIVEGNLVKDKGISPFLKNTLDNLFFKKSYSLEEPEFYSNKLLNAFTDEWKTKKREYTKNEGWKILNEGEIEGEVIVANIATLVSILASEYVPTFRNKILILEEMNATIDLEERNLNILKMSGVFEGVKGLIFSKPEVYNNKNSNLEYIDIIKEVLGKRDYPIIYNFDCGHTIPSLMISQDSLLSLKASDKEGIKVEVLKNCTPNPNFKIWGNLNLKYFKFFNHYFLIFLNILVNI